MSVLGCLAGGGGRLELVSWCGGCDGCGCSCSDVSKLPGDATNIQQLLLVTNIQVIHIMSQRGPRRNISHVTF